MTKTINYNLPIKLITQKDLISANCLNVSELLSVVENAFKSYAAGDVIFPEKMSVIFDSVSQNRINSLPAGIKSQNVFGVKWVSVFPENPQKNNVPNLSAVILLSSLSTGYPFAIMEGSFCSNLRTALVGSLAAKYFAKVDSTKIGFIGAGELAKTHFLVMKELFPKINTCKVSSRTTNSEKKFVSQLSRKYPDVKFIACNSDYEQAVSDADIIVTAISGQEKILQPSWIKKGAFYCHVAGLEDDFGVALKADKIVCDNWDMVKHRTQTISQMYKLNLLSDNDIYADLDEIILKKKKGRENDSEFIYFNSVGLSFIDIALANWMYKCVLDKGLYTDFSFKSNSMFDII
ncbi:ornithine cyclodeaminase family protein [bacterium]|nr:ornithine cyclodeaminase family protein [bacterium]